MLRNNPGRFAVPCLFWEKTYTSDGLGAGGNVSWAVAVNCPMWCRVEPIRGSEDIAAGRVVATSRAQIVIRRWADIHPAQVVEFRGDRWEIISIEDFGREGIMTLTVEKKS